jgi:hypothetical protein
MSPHQVRAARHEASCYAHALSKLEQEGAEPMSEVRPDDRRLRRVTAWPLLAARSGR